MSVGRKCDLPVIIGSNVLTAALIEAGLMCAAVVEVLVAQNASPVAVADALKGREAVTVQTAYTKEKKVRQCMFTHLLGKHRHIQL